MVLAAAGRRLAGERQPAVQRDVHLSDQQARSPRHPYALTPLLLTPLALSCAGWCPHNFRGYSALRDVQHLLRQNSAQAECRRKGLGFPRSPPDAVQMVWHVRTGDVCLNCRTSYYVRLFRSLKAALGGGRKVQLTFESQHVLQFPDGRLQDAPEFAGASFRVNASLKETVCRFLTTDVLATTGSSLPAMVVAFAPPWRPIVVEERIKGRIWEITHYNTREGAVLLMNGVVVSHSAQELSVLLRTALDERDRENREAGVEEWGLGEAPTTTRLALRSRR